MNRLRKKGCSGIPEAADHSYKEAPKQEVVRIEFNGTTAPVTSNSVPMYETSYPPQAPALPVMELSIGKVGIRISNEVDPILLTQTLRALRSSHARDITAADDIFIVCGRTDMRKSINGLCSIVQDQLHMDPRRSAIYLFCGK